MQANVVFLWLLCLQLCYVHAELTFEDFKQKQNKIYQSGSELARREKIFNDNLAKFEVHNQKYQQGLVSYRMGVNQFSDLTEEEFASKFKTWQLSDTLLKNSKTHDSSKLNVDELPKSIDWRKEGIVTGVKNQGSCGGCWAFSTTGTLEGQLALKQGNLISLSEQQLLDCDTDTNAACDGGIVQLALDYVVGNGLTTEDAYPYKAYKGSCQRGKKSAVRAEGYMNILQYNETDLKLAVGLIGPVSVAVYAEPIQSYETGIFNDVCSDDVDHGVLVVGYGADNSTGLEYWIIKNSWGNCWGENGYYRLAMGKGLCGIARQACYPIGVTSSGHFTKWNSIFGIIGLLLIGLERYFVWCSK